MARKPDPPAPGRPVTTAGDVLGKIAPKARAAAVSQSDFPAYSLEKALAIAQGLVDNFASKSGEPNQVAIAIKETPTSSGWRMLSGTAIAYGLTEGGYGAKEITLTERGRMAVAPTEEGLDAAARRDAILAPRFMAAFINKYNNQKWPAKSIGVNVLETLGLPRDRCPAGLDLIEANLRFVGALQQTNTGYMVMLSMVGSGIPAARESEFEPPPAREFELEQPPPKPATQQPAVAPGNVNVFITHGKNRELLETIKKAVTYARLNPIVSVEITDVAKPVPQKIIKEMRSCFGGIVHVRSEGEWTDKSGATHQKINDNVLIEIGGALTIYGDNFILLVEEGTELPSNLQGLFVCYYSGEKLDGDATMRLLEGLSKFSPPT